MQRSRGVVADAVRRLSSSRGRGINAANYPLGFAEAAGRDAPGESAGGRPGGPLDYNGVGRVRCYNCGQMGHVSYACALPQVRKACYTCGASGHQAREWYGARCGVRV